MPHSLLYSGWLLPLLLPSLPFLQLFTLFRLCLSCFFPLLVLSSFASLLCSLRLSFHFVFSLYSVSSSHTNSHVLSSPSVPLFLIYLYTSLRLHLLLYIPSESLFYYFFLPLTSSLTSHSSVSLTYSSSRSLPLPSCFYVYLSLIFCPLSIPSLLPFSPLRPFTLLAFHPFVPVLLPTSPWSSPPVSFTDKTFAQALRGINLTLLALSMD